MEGLLTQHSLRIRPAEHRDLEQLKSLYCQLDENCNTNLEDLSESLTNIIRSPHTHIIVGEINKEVVVACTLVVYENFARAPQRKGLIDSFIVAPKFRRQGFGTKMLEWVVDALRRDRCVQVLITVPKGLLKNSENLKRLGFEVAGECYINVHDFKVRTHK